MKTIRAQIIGFILVTCLMFPQLLLALRSGDNAVELSVDFISNGPVRVVPATVNKERDQNLRAVVFIRANAPGTYEALEQLYEIRGAYPKVAVVVVSADSKASSIETFDAIPNPNYATAVDKNMKTTIEYMGNSNLFPKAFVVDYRGRIIWDGEVLDLGNMLENFYSDKFNEKNQIEISIALEEMQSHLRIGEDRSAEYAMQRVLALDPANMAALRMRVFMLDSSNRYDDAWRLLERQQRKAPADRRIYLMMFDMAIRNPIFANRIEELTNSYLDKIPPNADGDCSLAWSLLTRRPFDPNALKLSKRLFKRTLEKELNSFEQVNLYSTAALYYSRVGALDKALILQKKATEVLKKHIPHRVASSEQMEEYYRTALEIEK